MGTKAYESYEYDLSTLGDEMIIIATAIPEGESVFKGIVHINATDTTLTSIAFHIPEDRKPYAKEINLLGIKFKLTNFIGNIIYTRTADQQYIDPCIFFNNPST